MSDSYDSLVDQALHASEPAERRAAFLELLRSAAHWRSALVADVIGAQTRVIRRSTQPDLTTLREAAELIASDEDKVQRVLELAGVPDSDALLGALARHMRSDLVEHALSHLRTADGYRRQILQRVLCDADPAWVNDAAALPTIRKHLRTPQGSRADLLEALVRAGTISDFIAVLRDVPPASPEEWNAVGRGACYDETLFQRAMTELALGPAPLLYLMRLAPVPAAAVARMLSAATAEWTVSALELAVVHGLDSRALIPLVVLSIRRGGPGLAFGMAWVSAAKLARPLLGALAEHLVRGGSEAVVDEMLRRRAMLPAPNRALTRGRQGIEPSVDDAAALVRQLEGEKARALVREVLSEPLPELIETVLHHLCALRSEAAAEVLVLLDEGHGEVMPRAQKVRAWPDIAWPAALDEPTARLEDL